MIEPVLDALELARSIVHEKLDQVSQETFIAAGLLEGERLVKAAGMSDA
jgi:hypothetical protein